jgi:hypothetical protein
LEIAKLLIGISACFVSIGFIVGLIIDQNNFEKEFLKGCDERCE